MATKGIRGAITVENNTEQALKEATLELLKAITEANNIKPDRISHAIFTTTKDLNATFPAKFASARSQPSTAETQRDAGRKVMNYHAKSYYYTLFCRKIKNFGKYFKLPT
jgi:hypothetical protein